MNSETTNYTETFKYQVATEAYCHTPSGGYSAVAERYKLPVALVFDWVEQFYPSPPAPFSSVHVWIGTTTKTATQFSDYFSYAQDYYEIDDDELTVKSTQCAFCIDLNTRYLYDEDLIFYHHAGQNLPVATLIKQLPLSTDGAELKIEAECAKRGLLQANAIFYYADPTQEIHELDKLYNDLIYLGLFLDKVS